MDEPGTAPLVTLGETMAVFIRESDAASDLYRLTAAGAESNVAIAAAQLGLHSRWVSRLGDDELGRFVHEFVAAHGVAVEVDWDDRLPTAACVKEVRPFQTRMRYYRSTSAARRFDLLDTSSVRRANQLHLTGVTPALSPQDGDLIESLMQQRLGESRTSFDVNYRSALWPDSEAATERLVRLARLADVVFIGDDEARVLLGADQTEAVADKLLVRPGQELVLKRGGDGASVVTATAQGRYDVVTEPARSVEVVDLTGAGDAFAGGYLVAEQWGWSPRGRLRLGHLLAAGVVGVAGDVGPTPHLGNVVEVARESGEVLPERIGAARR